MPTKHKRNYAEDPGDHQNLFDTLYALQVKRSIYKESINQNNQYTKW